MLNFTKGDGSIVQYHKECRVKLSREEFEERYNRSIIYRGSNGFTEMNVYTRDEDAPIDAKCYIKQLGDDPIQGYEIVVRNDKFIREGQIGFTKDGQAYTTETVGFNIKIYTKPQRGRQYGIFNIVYGYDEGMIIENDPERIQDGYIYRIYKGPNLELCSTTESKILEESTSMRSLTRVLPTGIEPLVEDNYRTYKHKDIIIDKVNGNRIDKTTLGFGDVSIFAGVLSSDITSSDYSRSYETDEREDTYVERFFIGGEEVLRIETDEKENGYFKIFKEGSVNPQIEIKLYYGDEFCFSVKDESGNYRNITIGELKELYKTLQFMADIRASSKDCNGSRKYEDLSFFCKTFFSLYPTLLAGYISDDGKKLTCDTEKTPKIFPELYKIGVFMELRIVQIWKK